MVTTNEMLFELLERMFEQYEERPGGWYYLGSAMTTDELSVDDPDQIALLESVAEYLYKGEADAIEE